MIKISKKLSHLETCAVSDLIDFQGDLKFLTDENKERLKKSIKKNGFFVPFFVWENKGKKWIIDGHQRLEVLKDLGYNGEVPFIPITAKTEKEAKEKLLVISSQYGTISQKGFDFFIDDLDFSNIESLVNFDNLVIHDLDSVDFSEFYQSDEVTESKQKKKIGNAIVLLSGGMDSYVLLHKYKANIKLAISFNYGSNHNAIELEFAKKAAKTLGIEHKIITLDFKKLGISSALLGDGDIPNGHYTDEIMKKTVVPYRNGIMLSIATAIADSNGLDSILIASHAGDHTIYPDCRKDFINEISKASTLGTDSRIKIIAPFSDITKREIAIIGSDLNLDFTNTYSCYNGEKIHCGECATCIERKEALNEFDNTKYKK